MACWESKLIDVGCVIDIFCEYCKNNDVMISRNDFIKNLALKKGNEDFKLDMNFLLPEYDAWDYEKAYAFVIDNITRKIADLEKQVLRRRVVPIMIR